MSKLTLVAVKKFVRSRGYRLPASGMSAGGETLHFTSRDQTLMEEAVRLNDKFKKKVKASLADSEDKRNVLEFMSNRSIVDEKGLIDAIKKEQNAVRSYPGAYSKLQKMLISARKLL